MECQLRAPNAFAKRLSIFFLKILVEQIRIEMNGRARELFDRYNSFKLGAIASRRFNQQRMLEWLRPFVEEYVVGTEPLGPSAEGRTISLYSYGSGATNILLWSQMHGDEPTATMALMDMLGFFRNHPTHEVARLIHERLTLRLIPMLNPDGAERFTRRTAQLVDLNRDALDLQTPEANILKSTHGRFNPEYAFNLHDQDPRYTVGTTKQITAIALLAPAFNEERLDNAVRMRAKKVAAMFAEAMNEFIPQQLAKWDDAYEPRAFGDSVQRWGTSTVLVESGGWKGDKEKMFLRKLNCVGLLTSLAAIADGSFDSADTQIYERIPFNTKFGFDLIIKNARLRSSDRASTVRVDVGINFDEATDERGTVQFMGKIIDVGDLSTFTAFEVREALGKLLDASKIGIERLISLEETEHLLR